MIQIRNNKLKYMFTKRQLFKYSNYLIFEISKD